MAENKELTQEQKEQFQNFLKTVKENQKKFIEALKNKNADNKPEEVAEEKPKTTAKKKKTTKK